MIEIQGCGLGDPRGDVDQDHLLCCSTIGRQVGDVQAHTTSADQGKTGDSRWPAAGPWRWGDPLGTAPIQASLQSTGTVSTRQSRAFQRPVDESNVDPFGGFPRQHSDDVPGPDLQDLSAPAAGVSDLLGADHTGASRHSAVVSTPSISPMAAVAASSAVCTEASLPDMKNRP